MLHRLGTLVGDNLPIKESDFTAVLFALLPHYIDKSRFVVVVPEAWNNNIFNRIGRCDGIIGTICIDPNDGFYSFGSIKAEIMYEAKTLAGKGWNALMEDQVWEQSDARKNPDGRLWVIVQRGFEICIFKYDSRRFYNWSNFRNFKPMNLKGLSFEDFMEIEAISLVEDVNNRPVIKVIRWKLNDELHRVHGA